MLFIPLADRQLPTVTYTLAQFNAQAKQLLTHKRITHFVRFVLSGIEMAPDESTSRRVVIALESELRPTFL